MIIDPNKAGGSSAINDEASDNSKLSSPFHENVKAFFLSVKNFNGKVRILPAFDYTLSKSDDSFTTSVVPYRNADEIDPETNHPSFNPWFFKLKGYKFFGTEGHRASFFHPATGQNTKYPKPGLNPVHDIWSLLYNKSSKKGDKSLDYLWSKKINPDAYLKTESDFVICNAYVQTFDKENPYEGVALVVMTKTAIEDLTGTLNELAGRQDPVISKNWESYRYGDITSPTDGCWLFKKEIKTDSGNNPAGLHPTNKAQSLDGFEQFQVGDEILKQRYDITDTDNVTKIWSYEEIVNFIVEDNIVPFEVVEEACGNFCKLPEPPKEAARKPTKTVSTENPFGGGEPENQKSAPEIKTNKEKPTDVQNTEENKSEGSDDEKAEYENLKELIMNGTNLDTQQLQRLAQLSAKFDA